MTNTEIAPMPVTPRVVGPTSVIPSRWSHLITAVLALAFFVGVFLYSVSSPDPTVTVSAPEDGPANLVAECLVKNGWHGLDDGHSRVYAPLSAVRSCERLTAPDAGGAPSLAPGVRAV